MPEDTMTIESPEQVRFTMELAGPGSRFVANLVDTILQGGLMAAVVATMIGTSLLSWPLLRSSLLASTAFSWLAALLVLALFLITWGYYALFETLWNGQTPGKRWVGLRVIRDGGYPIGFFEAMVRNLLRYVDFLPFGYGVGVTVMMLNRDFKRLGDFAAGTVVVKERCLVLSSLSDPPHPAGAGAAILPRLTVERLSRLDHAHYVIIREFLLRRDELDIEARERLANRVCRLACDQLGIDNVGPTWREKETFLVELADRYQGKSRGRRG